MGLTSLSAVLVAAAASLGSPRSPSLASALTPVLVPRGHLITANPTHAPTIDPDRSNDAVSGDDASGDDAPTAAPTGYSGRSPYNLTTLLTDNGRGDDIPTNNLVTVATKGGKNAQDRPNGRPRKDDLFHSDASADVVEGIAGIEDLHEIDARKADIDDIEGFVEDEEVTVNFTGDRNKGDKSEKADKASNKGHTDENGVLYVVDNSVESDDTDGSPLSPRAEEEPREDPATERYYSDCHRSSARQLHCAVLYTRPEF